MIIRAHSSLGHSLSEKGREMFSPSLAIIACLLFYGHANNVDAQSVDLLIQNIPQETDVWCWAAVAQQIIYFRQGPSGTPPQCHMVALANNAHPNVCCDHMGRYNGNPMCRRVGSLQQIQWLIGYFGGRFSTLEMPANPQVLFNTLNQGRPVIMAVKSSPYTDHVIVLRGISMHSGVPMLHVNDPMSHFTELIPFHDLLGFWHGAIVVH